MIVSCSMPETTATCWPLLVTAAVRRSGVPVEEDLPLRLSADLETIPRAFGDLDPGAREARMPAEQAFAERQTEALDLGAGMLPGGRMHEALQRLAGEESGRFAFDERVGEVTLETAARRSDRERRADRRGGRPAACGGAIRHGCWRRCGACRDNSTGVAGPWCPVDRRVPYNV